MREAIHKEIDKLKTTDVTDAELAMYKTRTRADLLRGLADNQGLANSLAEYQTRYGDWRELFLQLDRVDKVTKADIRRVANQSLSPPTAPARRSIPKLPPRNAKKTEARNEDERSVEEGRDLRRRDSACEAGSCHLLALLIPARPSAQQQSPGRQIPIPALHRVQSAAA